MNEQLLDRARAAYRSGDYAAAVRAFDAAKESGEVCGEADHLRGNALMRLGSYAAAAEAYGAALSDAAYGRQGALLTNRGKALAAAGDAAGACASFESAVLDRTYATPYKAYLGLGRAQLAQGNVAEAGAAFRQAAIDGANPAPAGALSSLGDCFVSLGRPEDAVEAYRTALDFAGPHDDARAINAGLGRAYAASNRFSDAVDAFGAATADGLYRLTPEQQADLDRARETLASAAAPEGAATGAADAIDPLDPLGQSGSFMPDPSDTGFFTLSESEMIQQDKREMKVRRKHRHTGLKVFLVILVLLVALGGGGAFALTRGFGVPSQQEVLTDLFKAVTDGDDTSAYLADGLSDSAKSAIASSIPSGAEPSIEGMDPSLTSSTAKVTAKLSQGGTMDYDVEFVRSGIGWKVSALSIDAGSSSSDASTSDTSSSSDTSSTSDDSSSSDSSSDASSADAPAADDAPATDASATDASAQ